MKKERNSKSCFLLLNILVLVWQLSLFSCRGDEVILLAEYEPLPGMTADPQANPVGMYLLNEGNMGSNKATLDYLDFRQAIYIRNLYAERNPSVIKDLGDVGNDIQIYGNRLYIVVNCSHKVEVLDVGSGERIGQIDIPNCRYIRFHDDKAYVSSYIGSVQVGSSSPKGAVYQIDTLNLQILERVTVGYQPEEMEVIGNYLYVANSGGYMSPEYDQTVSVIDLESFRQVEKIPVGINLHRIKKDRLGQLWVTSRGDNKGVSSNLFVLERNAKTGRVATDTLNIPCSNLAICGDSVYLLSSQWSEADRKNKVAYRIIDIRTRALVSEQFIKDGTDQKISRPYSLTIHPVSRDIYVTDARNYISSGQLYCFTKEGVLKWSLRTGDIPVGMAFHMDPALPE